MQDARERPGAPDTLSGPRTRLWVRKWERNKRGFFLLGAMPHYFLHIRTPDELIEDKEGIDASDFFAARQKALDGAVDMVAERVKNGGKPDGEIIEIRDSAGELLGVIEFKSLFKGTQ